MPGRPSGGSGSSTRRARSTSPPWGSRERAFLLASRRAVTRQRWGRWLAALVLALAVAASYGGLRLQAYLEDARFVAAQLGTAREALATGRDLAQQASERREEALALFDGRAPPQGPAPHGPSGLLEAAERQWAEALALREQADAAYARASQEPGARRWIGITATWDAHRLIAEVTYRAHPPRRALPPAAPSATSGRSAWSRWPTTSKEGDSSGGSGSRRRPSSSW